MKNRIITRIAVFGIMAVILSMLVYPVLGAPLTGAQGDRIKANFMSQDPDPANAGKDVDLRWQVVNTISGAVESLRFHLDAGYPFLFEAGDSPDKNLGPSAGTNDNQVFYIVHYKLRVADNAVKGTYNVTLSWSTGEGWTKRDFPVYIDPRKADFVVGALVTSPEKLVADTNEAKLSVNIDNLGKGNAENVKVRILLPPGFSPTYSYSDQDNLGIIQKGSGKTANFFVDIGENVKEGEYTAGLELTYKDENDENSTYRTKTLDLAIPVKPSLYLVIESVTTAPENLAPGTEADVRIKVKNTGNEKAQSVSLRVFKDASQPFDFGEKSDFIGKLEHDESGDAVLKVTVDNKASFKKYLLDVELRGIDEKNNVVIFRRTVPLTVNTEEKRLPSVGVFAAVAAVISVFAYLKKKKNL